MQTRSSKVFWWAVGIALFGLVAARMTNSRPAGPTSTAWQTEFRTDLTRALVKAGVTGCGQYKYRQSATDAGALLVHCTRDGTNWNAYVVSPSTGAVTGPEPATAD